MVTLKSRFLLRYFGVNAALLTTALSALASAGEVPNCWEQAAVHPGHFNIVIEPEHVSKETLLELLDRASGRYITPTRYPLVGTGRYGYVIIPITEIDSGVGPRKLTRKQLTAAVQAELQPFANTHGVVIECEHIVSPAGKIEVREF